MRVERLDWGRPETIKFVEKNMRFTKKFHLQRKMYGDSTFLQTVHLKTIFWKFKLQCAFKLNAVIFESTPRKIHSPSHSSEAILKKIRNFSGIFPTLIFQMSFLMGWIITWITQTVESIHQCKRQLRTR